MTERYTDFKKGDIVRIRSWEDMEAEFGVTSDGNIPCKFTFTNEMKYFCEQKAEIVDMNRRCIYLNFENKSLNDSIFSF